MIYVGIDPGAKGGWSVINGDKAEAHIWDDVGFVQCMRYISSLNAEVRCCLEKVGAMPGQGVVSMFNFGKGFGYIMGVLSAFNIPYQLVPPRVWKKDFSLFNQDKDASIEIAQRLFPDVNLLPTPRCKNPSDGMAESLLMAEYARRHF